MEGGRKEGGKEGSRENVRKERRNPTRMVSAVRVPTRITASRLESGSELYPSLVSDSSRYSSLDSFRVRFSHVRDGVF